MRFSQAKGEFCSHAFVETWRRGGAPGWGVMLRIRGVSCFAFEGSLASLEGSWGTLSHLHIN